MNRFEREPRFERELELRRLKKQNTAEFIRIYQTIAGPIPQQGIRVSVMIKAILDQEFPPLGGGQAGFSN